MNELNAGMRTGEAVGAPIIFLRAGHHKDDPGAVANGYIERDLTIELRDLLAYELRWAGFTVDVDDDRDSLAVDVQKIANACRPHDLLLDIHFNAATPQTTGTECFVPFNAEAKEIEIAAAIADTCAHVLGIQNRHKYNGNKPKLESQSQHGRLAVMRPNCINVLWEVCFITNTNDMKQYKDRLPELVKEISKKLKELHSV